MEKTKLARAIADIFVALSECQWTSCLHSLLGLVLMCGLQLAVKADSNARMALSNEIPALLARP